MRAILEALIASWCAGIEEPEKKVIESLGYAILKVKGKVTIL